jgi:hypothetical protein
MQFNFNNERYRNVGWPERRAAHRFDKKAVNRPFVTLRRDQPA